ncbi:MAG TPA: hypothetical protein VN026_15785 [Bacteroidia bacterium]|jgi:hypothetical protein|nr:hypothetical protein [Bacteroidia bacterium]
MKKKLRHIFSLALIAIFSSLNAQQIKVNAVLDSSKIRIGEQTKLDVYVTYDANAQKSLKVQWPSFEDTITGKVEIVSRTVIDSTIPDKNNPSIIQQHQQFVVTAFDSGYFAIPPFKFFVNGDTVNPVLTDALFLEVNTIPTDTTDATIKDIKPPFEEPFDWKWYLPMVYWGAATILIIALIVFVIIKLTKKKPEQIVERKPDVPPHILALEQLERVKNEAVWKDGKTKEYYSAISDSVRLYIEGRFGIQALELTTDEIVRAFKSQVVDSVSKEKLQQMLVLSDFVKFAKVIPIEQEHAIALQNAFDFVNGTKREDEIVIEENNELPNNTEEPK